MSAKPYKRKIVNLLLQPVIQLKIGFVNTVITLIFVGGLGWYAFDRLHQITDVITTLTQADAEISALIATYLQSVAKVAAIVAVTFVVVSVLATVWMTHKLVGPTVAFRRHINQLIEGKFGSRVTLRKGDAFIEVAEDLNRLSETLVRYKSK